MEDPRWKPHRCIFLDAGPAFNIREPVRCGSSAPAQQSGAPLSGRIISTQAQCKPQRVFRRQIAKCGSGQEAALLDFCVLLPENSPKKSSCLVFAFCCFRAKQNRLLNLQLAEVMRVSAGQLDADTFLQGERGRLKGGLALESATKRKNQADRSRPRILEQQNEKTKQAGLPERDANEVCDGR